MGDFNKVYNRPVGFTSNLPYVPVTFDQLTAPGSTDEFECIDYLYHTFQYKITLIDTNVVVRAEGSLDGTNWANLDANDVDTTQTANGTYLFTFFGKINFIRFTFVSEAGGTAAKIDVKYLGGV
jgi:hypothetical protein